MFAFFVRRWPSHGAGFTAAGLVSRPAGIGRSEGNGESRDWPWQWRTYFRAASSHVPDVSLHQCIVQTYPFKDTVVLLHPRRMGQRLEGPW
jgi:hypothetical protein